MGDACPPRAADRASRGFPPYSIGARLPRTPAGRARSGARSTRSVRPATERGRDELNERARAARPAAARPRARRHLAPARAGRDLPAARVPAHVVVAVDAGDRAAAVGAAVRATSSCRRATTRSCWSRPAPRRTPSSGCCARRWRGSPTSRCACSRPPTAAAPPRPLPVPAERAAWSTGSPTRARCRTARRSSATPATAPSCARWRAACRWWPARPRATWPRTPRGWHGRASACRCRAAWSPRAGSGWRCGGCWRTRATRRARARAGRLGERATTARERGGELERSLEEKLRGWDSNPQPFD